MKTRSILILFLLPFLCLAYSKEYGEDQILEEKYISINGIDHWVTIKGNPSKPIVLFLHGGPGSVLSPYADAIYDDWKKDFILIQWDQRGAGRTFGRSAPTELSLAYFESNPLTLEQMVSDGIELSEYLIKHLGKQKIILFGTSWGSVLGTKMAIQRPDLFYAYIGHAQVVNPTEGFNYAYQKVSELTQIEKDTISIQKLKTIGKPPYNNAKNYGQLLRIVKKYERDNSIPAPATWWKLPPEYDNENDIRNRYLGDDYSFASYVGHKALGIQSMSSEINFMKSGLNFKIPVFLIQGEKDILTPKEITTAYFDKINTPNKAYFLLPDAAHGFNESVINTQYKILKKYIAPLITK